MKIFIQSAILLYILLMETAKEIGAIPILSKKKFSSATRSQTNRSRKHNHHRNDVGPIHFTTAIVENERLLMRPRLDNFTSHTNRQSRHKTPKTVLNPLKTNKRVSNSTRTKHRHPKKNKRKIPSSSNLRHLVIKKISKGRSVGNSAPKNEQNKKKKRIYIDLYHPKDTSVTTEKEELTDPGFVSDGVGVDDKSSTKIPSEHKIIKTTEISFTNYQQKLLSSTISPSGSNEGKDSPIDLTSTSVSIMLTTTRPLDSVTSSVPTTTLSEGSSSSLFVREGNKVYVDLDYIPKTPSPLSTVTTEKPVIHSTSKVPLHKLTSTTVQSETVTSKSHQPTSTASSIKPNVSLKPTSCMVVNHDGKLYIELKCLLKVQWPSSTQEDVAKSTATVSPFQSKEPIYLISPPPVKLPTTLKDLEASTISSRLGPESTSEVTSSNSKTENPVNSPKFFINIQGDDSQFETLTPTALSYRSSVHSEKIPALSVESTSISPLGQSMMINNDETTTGTIHNSVPIISLAKPHRPRVYIDIDGDDDSSEIETTTSSINRHLKSSTDTTGSVLKSSTNGIGLTSASTTESQSSTAVDTKNIITSSAIPLIKVESTTTSSERIVSSTIISKVYATTAKTKPCIKAEQTVTADPNKVYLDLLEDNDKTSASFTPLKLCDNNEKGDDLTKMITVNPLKLKTTETNPNLKPTTPNSLVDSSETLNSETSTEVTTSGQKDDPNSNSIEDFPSTSPITVQNNSTKMQKATKTLSILASDFPPVYYDYGPHPEEYDDDKYEENPYFFDYYEEYKLRGSVGDGHCCI